MKYKKKKKIIIPTLLFQRRNLQDVLYSKLEQFNAKINDVEFPIESVNLKSKLSLSELNLLKAQRYSFLRAFVINKGYCQKGNDELYINFNNCGKRAIFRILELANRFPSKAELKKSELKILQDDILIYLRKMDFFKINESALSNIEICFKINKRIIDFNGVDDDDVDKWIINEILGSKRF